MHTFMTEEHPVDATGLYAATKLASESLGLTYHRTYGLHFVALRFATVYGPRFGVGESRIGQLWNDLVQRSLCGQDVRLDVPAFLSQPNDYVYVKDVAQALGHAVLSDTVAHRLFNIGSGDLSRVSDLVRIVSELIPHSCITVHEASDAVRDWPVRRPYDMKRSRDELQYVPQFDLRRGLTDQLSVTRHQLGLDDSVSD